MPDLDERDFKLRLARIVLGPMIPKEVPVPAGSKCTKCGSESLTRKSALAWGPWGGSVTCSSCGHVESVMNHLAKTCISVEPLGEECGRCKGTGNEPDYAGSTYKPILGSDGDRLETPVMPRLPREGSDHRPT